MNLGDLVLNFLIDLCQNPNIVLPIFVWVLASWRVARLRQLTMDNYEERVTESVGDTIKEQIIQNYLTPLFEEKKIPLPRGKSTYDVMEKLCEQNPTDLAFLSEIYSSLETLGGNSEYFIQAVQIASNFFLG